MSLLNNLTLPELLLFGFGLLLLAGWLVLIAKCPKIR